MQIFPKRLADLPGEERWHGVTHLDELLGFVALEKVVVEEGLQSGGFAHADRATLLFVRMDEVMTVLRQMAGHRGRRQIPQLNAKPVREDAVAPVLVLGS